MLDEILEYQQYTVKPAETGTPQRLKYATLKDRLSGISRAMQIVARGFMDREFADLTPEEKFEKTKVILMQWCGAYEPGEDEENFGMSVQNWFPIYIEDSLIPGAKFAESQRKLRDMLNNLPQTYKSFNRAEFWIGQKGANTANKITYERIIHEAGRMGELKRYYLCTAKPLEKEDLIRETENGGKHPNDNQMDLVLKGIAAYLLENPERNNADGMRCRYAQICWADILNWSMGTFKDGARLLTEFDWGGRPVFERESSRYQQNYTKFRLSRGFMDTYRWQLVREADLPEFLDTHPGYAIYRDEGTGVPFTRFTAGKDPIEKIFRSKQA